MHHSGAKRVAGMLSHIPSDVVPGKRATQVRPGTHNHRRVLHRAPERHRAQQQAPVVMGPGSHSAWPGRRRGSCLTFEYGRSHEASLRQP